MGKTKQQKVKDFLINNGGYYCNVHSGNLYWFDIQ